MRSVAFAIAIAFAIALAATASRADISEPFAEFVRSDGSALDPSKDGASPTREAPGSTLESQVEKDGHPDWLRVRARSGVSEVTLISRSEVGREMDRVILRRRGNAFEGVRLVTEQSDRIDAQGVYRSLVVDFGGAVELVAGAAVASRLRVTGPFGVAGALRLRIRAMVVRYDDSGASGAGSSDGDAQRRIARDLRLALAAWTQCGIGTGADMPITFVSKPPAHLLAVGTGYGLPASGGVVRFAIAGRALSVPVQKGTSALGAALVIATAARHLGFHVDVAENERSLAQAGASADLSFRTRAGKLVELTSPGPVSSDATLDVRIGVVDLRDGLDHFREEDSQTGTLEERTLLRAVSDGDPTRITMALVPAFAGTGARLGESFIPSDGSTLAPMVLVDQRGVSMGAASMVAPHELGHVLLDQPGHPDAFGVDTPTRLMDSDASDASAYGPRRLTLDECELARDRSLARGILERWPLRPWTQAPKN